MSRSILNEIRLTTGSAVISTLERPWGGTEPLQLYDVTSAQYLTLWLVEDTFVPALACLESDSSTSQLECLSVVNSFPVPCYFLLTPVFSTTPASFRVKISLFLPKGVLAHFRKTNCSFLIQQLFTNLPLCFTHSHEVFLVKCCNEVTLESSVCIVCFDETVVTEAKAWNHCSHSQCYVQNTSCQVRDETEVTDFLFFWVAIRSLYCVFWQFQWKQHFVPVVFCDRGLLWRLKTKMSTYFSLDCNSFFLYQIFIGENEGGRKKIEMPSSFTVF